MNRIVTAALTAGIAAALTLVATPAFADVSNPASNPYKITVTGDDGQTYVDGQDTLPGFDDEACTYIPGAWFDFDNNRVHYPDGQSIPWTEWSRATGYQEWLAKKASQNTTTSNTSSGGSTSGTTTSGGTTTSTTAQSGRKTTTQGGTGTAGVGTTSTNPTASPSESAGATASPEASEAIEVYSGEEAEASASPSEDAVVLADGSDAAQSGGGAQAAGLAILGILFALGGLGFGIYTVLNQRRSPKPQAI